VPTAVMAAERKFVRALNNTNQRYWIQLHYNGNTTLTSTLINIATGARYVGSINNANNNWIPRIQLANSDPSALLAGPKYSIRY